MSVRPMFKQRGASKKKKSAKTKLHVVNPANAKSTKKNNPAESAIPWKTIIATTMVTSIVSTFAVTFARFLLERTRARKEMKALGFAQAGQRQAIANPANSQHYQPAMSLPAPPHVPHAGETPLSLVQGMPFAPSSPPFDTNPFSAAQMQRTLALPEAPHVRSNPESNDEPKWFSDFREDYDRRLQTMESQVRAQTKDRHTA